MAFLPEKSTRWMFLKQRPILTYAFTLSAACLIAACAQYYLSEKQRKKDEGRDTQSAVTIRDDVPEDCPGTQTEQAGHAPACEGCPNRKICASGALDNARVDIAAIADRLSDIKKIILVLSGKGGVGKSTIASQVAWELESRGRTVGILDIDICGPSIPTMTGTRDQDVKPFSEGWIPVAKTENLLVMSIGFLIPNEDSAIIWRGPRKNGLIRQFLTDVYWGHLDYLIIDTPPGTSDEHLSIVTYLKDAGVKGAIVVTMPQQVSLRDVRKEINFCKEIDLEVLGVVENMCKSLFVAKESDNAKKMCEEMKVPYAGTVDLSAAIFEACENGKRVNPNTEAAAQIKAIVKSCLGE